MAKLVSYGVVPCPQLATRVDGHIRASVNQSYTAIYQSKSEGNSKATVDRITNDKLKRRRSESQNEELIEIDRRRMKTLKAFK